MWGARMPAGAASPWELNFHALQSTLTAALSLALPAGTSSTPASSSTTAASWPAPTRWANSTLQCSLSAAALRNAPATKSSAWGSSQRLALELHKRHHLQHARAAAIWCRCPPTLQNKPDTNGSQFFVTLDRADHCNRQYTIFGKITGECGTRLFAAAV